MNLNIIRKKYKALYGEEPASAEDINRIEISLGINLPNDFRRITEFWRGGIIGDIPMLEIASGATENVLTETLRLRDSISLNTGCLVLSDLSESIILLVCSEGNMYGKVLWFDANILLSQASMDFSDVSRAEKDWGSFSEYFLYLLDEEYRNRGVLNE